ncbi:hypothetical protein GF406_01755 [candidate division KSB1 bacterium]|nr:hypothetical protein [candidate division KSB1 bacterium]
MKKICFCLFLIISSSLFGQEIVALGHFPDMVADRFGNLHIAYGRNDTLFYKKFDAEKKSWSAEISPLNSIIRAPNNFGIRRSVPDIVVDSEGNPYLFAGSDFVYLKKGTWIRVRPLPRLIRDTELAIDSENTLYLVHRGGNNGGYMGILSFRPGEDQWVPLTDPDKDALSRNDHVYGDISICPKTNDLFVIQRHAVPTKVTCNISRDGGKTWIHEGISDEEHESPHIIVDNNGTGYATLGNGTFFVRQGENKWVSEGRAVTAEKREQPELSVDMENNIYCGSWGGKYNIRVNGQWIGEKTLLPKSQRSVVGYVEFASSKNSTYIIWEEGDKGTGDSGMTLNSVVLVARINTNGSILPMDSR